MLEAMELRQTYPWTWYVDDGVLRAEQERIFRRVWQYVGHTGQVAEAGSSFTGRAGLVPVVVTRDRDAELRACSSGVPVQVDTWGPFVFVNPDPDAPPLAETLRELPELVASVGVDVDDLRHHHRSESSLDANWKIVSENFLECYHCAVAHPSFSAMVDVSPDAYRLETSGAVSTQLGPLRENGTNGYDPSGEVERGQFHFVFPSLAINILPGRPNLSLGPVNPVTPTRTARFLDYFFAPDADEGWIEELVAFDSQVGDEDRVLVEAVQRGVAAGAIEHGRLMGEAERLIVHFQEQVAAALAGSASTVEARGGTFA
jgi:phenylpropionate dioxygenase-like ring-hydroxylating dioxygenase large terminal subunit